MLKQQAGRGKDHGKITVRHRGGGAKRLYRLVDFKRDKYDLPGTIEAIEYDPNRNPRIALVGYADGEKRYILGTSSLKVGDVVVSSTGPIAIKDGNHLPLKHIPVGTFVHNIEFAPGKGGGLVRTAGGAAQIMGMEGKFVQLKLPSGERRMVLAECSATVGVLGNADYRLVRWGKAGRRRHLGWRPTVRGKAMNPVDHPHGGGEGNQPIGLKKGPKTRWGKQAFGVRTRRSRQSDSLIIERRAKKK